jgi:hypothetical protein
MQEEKLNLTAEEIELLNQVEQDGTLVQGPYVLTIKQDTPEISVRDTRTGLLVAFSSTRADYVQSLSEFVHDYMAP